jgi:hypothetical protein
LPGLNKAAWKGDPEIWDEIQHHTNAVESSHHKSNAFSIGLLLLAAVEM